MTKSAVPEPTVVGVHEAKTHLSELLTRVEAGEDIAIARRGDVVARLVPVRRTGRRQLGLDRDQLIISDDFDHPLPEELLESFGS